jgi:hypothetical protein
MQRAESLEGRTVIARTKDGEKRGKVREVLSREEAEKRLGIRKPQRLKSGRYLIIQGVSYPIRRARCKLVVDRKRNKQTKEES